MPRRTARAAILVSLLTIAPGLAARADLVNLIPGSTIKSPGNVVRGTVVAESPSEVTVKVGTGNQVVPVGQIASIRYDGRPAGSLDLAASREGTGNLVEAADLYKKAAGEAAGKPFVIDDALYNQARVIADLGLTDPSKLDAAIAAVDAFLKEHGNSRHVLPSLDTLAKLQMEKGSFDAAAQTLDRLAKIPGSGDKASALRSRIATKKGDHEAAVRELDATIAEAPEGSVKRRDAQLAKAESLVALKKYAEAQSLVRGVIAAAPPEDAAVQAIAYNTLGDCLRAEGPTHAKDALYAYLHVDLLYFKEKDQHARALAEIVSLWRGMKRDERADEALERLKSDYPKSKYTAALAKPTG